MSLINQLHQIGFIAKMRIDARIVYGVILVVGSGFKNRGQIQGVHSQFFQIGKLLGNTRQISAHKNLSVRRGAPRRHILRRKLRISVAKALRKNLIEHRTVDPRWLFVDVNAIDKRKMEVNKG